MHFLEFQITNKSNIQILIHIKKMSHKINRFHRNLLLNQAMSLAIEVCSLDKRWRQFRVSELFNTWKKKSCKVVRLFINL